MLLSIFIFLFDRKPSATLTANRGSRAANKYVTGFDHENTAASDGETGRLLSWLVGRAARPSSFSFNEKDRKTDDVICQWAAH